jgi:hypothetical protein
MKLKLVITEIEHKHYSKGWITKSRYELINANNEALNVKEPFSHFCFKCLNDIDLSAILEHKMYYNNIHHIKFEVIKIFVEAYRNMGFMNMHDEEFNELISIKDIKPYVFILDYQHIVDFMDRAVN